MAFKSFSILDLITTEEAFKKYQDRLREDRPDDPQLSMTFEEWRSKCCSVGDILEAAMTQKH